MKQTMRHIGVGASIIALAICIVLITGSTFSLFTDSDGSDIVVGSSKVELTASISYDTLTLSSKGVEQAATEAGKFFENGGSATLENGTLTLKNVAPGDEVTFNITLTNDSTIDIQYRVTYTYEGELAEALVYTTNAADVNQWIEWKAPKNDAEKERNVTVSVKLPIDANNDWQTKSANIHFSIEAVQANGVQENNVVTTADQLYVALERNSLAILGADIQLEKTLVIGKNATLYLAGHTLTNENGDAVVNNGTLTIHEGSPATVYSLRRNAQSHTEAPVGSIVSANGSAIVNNGTLTINGGNFEGTGAAAVVNTEEAVKLVVDGGNFESDVVEFAISYATTENVTLNEGVTCSGEVPADISEVIGEGLSAIPDENGNVVIGQIPVIVVTSVDELLAALEGANKGDVIDATGVTVDINSVGTDVPGGKRGLTIKGGITLKGLNIVGSYRGGNYLIFNGTADEEVVLENCTIEPGTRVMGMGLLSLNDGVGSVVCNNCTFKGAVILEFTGNSATFNNCTFTRSASGNQYVMAQGGTQTFNNCTFDYTGITSSNMGIANTACINVMSESDGSISTVVILNGCTRINCGTHKYGSDSTLIIK